MLPSKFNKPFSQCDFEISSTPSKMTADGAEPADDELEKSEADEDASGNASSAMNNRQSSYEICVVCSALMCLRKRENIRKPSGRTSKKALWSKPKYHIELKNDKMFAPMETT